MSQGDLNTAAALRVAKECDPTESRTKGTVTFSIGDMTETCSCPDES